ncbi:hypothetical protein [Dialister sp.]|nr:hypothetical protein [Dialister sp.]MEE3453428.1 hypothetical protein [Dialister sp.]
MTKTMKDKQGHCRETLQCPCFAGEKLKIPEMHNSRPRGMYHFL